MLEYLVDFKKGVSAMNPIDQYDTLTHEFEKDLNRKLTDKEQGFIKWIIKKQIKDLQKCQVC